MEVLRSSSKSSEPNLKYYRTRPIVNGDRHDRDKIAAKREETEVNLLDELLKKYCDSAASIGIITARDLLYGRTTVTQALNVTRATRVDRSLPATGAAGDRTVVFHPNHLTTQTPSTIPVDPIGSNCFNSANTNRLFSNVSIICGPGEEASARRCLYTRCTTQGDQADVVDKWADKVARGRRRVLGGGDQADVADKWADKVARGRRRVLGGVYILGARCGVCRQVGRQSGPGEEASARRCLYTRCTTQGDQADVADKWADKVARGRRRGDQADLVDKWADKVVRGRRTYVAAGVCACECAGKSVDQLRPRVRYSREQCGLIIARHLHHKDFRICKRASSHATPFVSIWEAGVARLIQFLSEVRWITTRVLPSDDNAGPPRRSVGQKLTRAMNITTRVLPNDDNAGPPRRSVGQKRTRAMNITTRVLPNDDNAGPPRRSVGQKRSPPVSCRATILLDLHVAVSAGTYKITTRVLPSDDNAGPPRRSVDQKLTRAMNITTRVLPNDDNAGPPRRSVGQKRTRAMNITTRVLPNDDNAGLPRRGVGQNVHGQLSKIYICTCPSTLRITTRVLPSDDTAGPPRRGVGRNVQIVSAATANHCVLTLHPDNGTLNRPVKVRGGLHRISEPPAGVPTARPGAVVADNGRGPGASPPSTVTRTASSRRSYAKQELKTAHPPAGDRRGNPTTEGIALAVRSAQEGRDAGNSFSFKI
ncbi:hypothetical protein J6590_029239 [Homalodisca vitripennis]|nr:hypothetical protein J6590_029239 [Homalodisca vitripennis]